MKKIISINFFLTIYFLNAFTVNSQTLNQLEEKKGFKDFKIGQDFSQWKNELTFKEGKTYVYNGNCCSSVFNYSASNIYLTFSNNKLVVIQINIFPIGKKGDSFTGKLAYPEFENLNLNFIRLFGKPTEIKTYPDAIGNPDISYAWMANSVHLETFLYYKGFKTGYFPIIIISDKKYLLEMLNNGF